MPTPAEILNDPNYIGANEATKQAIFDKHVASSADYTSANPQTQAAIRQRFGLTSAAPVDQPVAQPAAQPSSPSLMDRFKDLARQRMAQQQQADVKTQELFGKNRPAQFSGIPAYLEAGGESAAIAAPIGAGIGLVTGGPAGAVVGGTTAIPLGFAGGVLSQGAKDLGFGPGTQMLAGAVPIPGANTLTQTVSKGVTPAIERVGAALYSQLPYKVRAGLSALSKPGETLPQSAQDVLRGGAAPSRAAEEQVAQSVRQGAAGAVEASRAQAEAQKAAIEAKHAQAVQQQRERVAAMRGEVSKAKAAEQQATNEAAAQLTGLQPVSPSELGAEAQGLLVGREQTLRQQIGAQYQTKLKEFLDFARGEQREGRFWDASDAGKAAIDKLRSMMKPTEEMGQVRALGKEQEKAVQDVLDEIQGTRKVTVMDPYPETRTEKVPVDALVVDNVIRKLGEAAKGQPPQGYEAINKELALEMRRVLRKGVEDWAGTYGEAKRSYQEGSKLLEEFTDSQISGVTKTSNLIRDKLTTDPQGVGKTIFKSTQSVKDLTQALGGDTATVQRLAKQHVNNELYALGGDPAKTERWLNNPKNQEWMKEAGIEGYGREFSATIKNLTEKARGAAVGVKTGEGKLTREALGAREEKLAADRAAALENVRKQASAYEQKISSTINAGDVNAVLFENTIKNADMKTLKTVGKLLDDKGRAAMPDAVRQFMSRSSPAKLVDNWNKLKPMLESGNLLNPEQIGRLNKDVQRAVEAMGPNPTKKQINQLAIRISSQIGAGVGEMAVAE